MPTRQRSDPNSQYKFGFNGKEKDNDTCVDGDSFPMAIGIRSRIYDSRLGRWLSLDTLAKKYPKLSPYNFKNNNPLLFVDIDGKDWLLYCGTTITWYSGSYGVTTNAIKFYKATSGASGINDANGQPYQQSNLQNEIDKGPCVGGKYSINLTLPCRTSTKKSDGSLNWSLGITTLPWEDGSLYLGWGQWRAAFEPDAATAANIKANNRTGGFFLHDSYKGESHGYVEVESTLYQDIIDYQAKGNTTLEVKVEYPKVTPPGTGVSTNGGTGTWTSDIMNATYTLSPSTYSTIKYGTLPLYEVFVPLSGTPPWSLSTRTLPPLIQFSYDKNNKPNAYLNVSYELPVANNRVASPTQPPITPTQTSSPSPCP